MVGFSSLRMTGKRRCADYASVKNRPVATGPGRRKRGRASFLRSIRTGWSSVLMGGVSRWSWPAVNGPQRSGACAQLRSGACAQLRGWRSPSDCTIGSRPSRSVQQTQIRYVRTLYSGAVTVRLAGWKQGAELTGLVARLASDPDVGNPANPRVLPAPTPIAAPVIPPAVGQGHLDPPSSTSGGGGADAPWAILTLLAAGVIRVSGEQAA